jgi:hypothetical protein
MLAASHCWIVHQAIILVFILTITLTLDFIIDGEATYAFDFFVKSESIFQ